MNHNDFESHCRALGYQTFAWVSRDNDYALDEHTHPFDARALVVEGSITLTVGGVSTTYEANDVFELAMHTPHFEHTGLYGVRYYAARRT
jgi:mannose-6-phosphate isomerase-like protein (cupin superfamily)